MKTRILLEGTMPHRALNRLQRLGIAVEGVKKRKKNQIVFTTSEKDSEKVFAIYPSVCYNERGSVAYTAKKLPTRGLVGVLDKIRKRIGLLLGGLLFLGGTLYADGLVLSVEIVGETQYEGEILDLLEEGGVKRFTRYRNEKEDLICSRILALPSVSFCSLKKSGTRLIVEVVQSSFAAEQTRTMQLVSPVEGVIVELTVLSGKALLAVGDQVAAGEVIVAPTVTGGQGGVAVARACVLCTYVCTLEDATEEEAKARCYLEISLCEEPVTIDTLTVERDGRFTIVRADYRRIVCVNYD
jgi:hypothetical protein